MTRRARGPSAWARGLPVVGGSCLLASCLALLSCDSRFEFERLTESEGGAGAGGRFGGLGGFGHGGLGGFGDGFGYGGLAGGFGIGSTGGVSRGGTDSGGGEACLASCADAGLKCNENSKLCVECLEHSDCTRDGRVRCGPAVDGDYNPIANRCVQCLDDDDCRANEICQDDVHTCVARCSEDNDECGTGLVCSTISRYCAGCFSATCKEKELPFCLSKVRCGACSEDRDCQGDDDEANLCDPVDFKCVECRTSKDCKEGGQICNRDSHVCQDGLLQR